ncbi:DNA primase large subunit-like isoform X1 [Hylaeus volcanicus]|uniref:DNA primase large subunit-like isoform X1 n=1 Tax=Hylaeus volcanicus TaxID=313075 RepID=UPI0023B7DCF0|nr:DNA primase large subunit-like isoform X1 [Hylaeus volcanicus]XP_053978781.1 DNA primase large subunit-like isoform X1 [Hylaeus volcanicus]
MEYTKRRRYTVHVETNSLQDIYQHDLQMYDFPPKGEIPFVEFQQLGIDRLKLLQHIENNAVRTDLKKLKDRKDELCTVLAKDGLKYFVHLLLAKGCNSSTEMDLQCRKKDHLSHFIMRLSYCQNPERSMWFVKQEVELFKLRFDSLDKEGIEKLLSMHNIECQQITQEEKLQIWEELSSCNPKSSNIDLIEFYKVPFQKVADLVKSRKVYLSLGKAYISQENLVSLFVTYFRKNLIDGMEYAKKYVSNISDDERLMSYVKSLPGAFSGMTRVVWTTTTTPVEKLDELSKTSYPLCMRTLHEGLRTQHHLKNSARIQYGLFIKGIGVTLEDALRFWKMEFTKKIDPDKFDKQYAYSIRHIYGKEGKQTNYTPLGCSKIISSSVGPGEYHGCPYRHMDSESLKQKLSSYGVPVKNINDIADLAKDGHYHIACATYFEVLHNRLPDKPIIHPNIYFVESRAILAKDTGTESENTDKLSQSGRLSEKVSHTPTRSERNTDTPSRYNDRSIGTPSRYIGKSSTPSRRIDKTNMTPIRAVKAVPKRINNDNYLNAEDIAELMSEDM